MKKLLFAILAAASGVAAFSLFAGNSNPVLTRVKPELVCMVNDKFMGSPQIPVRIGKETYYGCCQGCVAALTNDPKSRMAVDPVGKQKVDKAKAVIGKDAAGKVYYFKSLKELLAYGAGKALGGSTQAGSTSGKAK